MNMKYLVGAVALCFASSATFAAATGASCKSTGSVSVSAEIKIDGGTYDGGCKTFNATSALGDGSQGEAQKPYFRIMNGATLKNVILGKNGADGIHSWYGGTLDNITWTDVGEDAFTLKKAGNVTLKNITTHAGTDKIIQQNDVGTITVTNCIVDGAAKFYRQNGGKTWKAVINASNCTLSNFTEGIFRTDGPNSTASLTNSRIHNTGTACIGYTSGNCKLSSVTTF